MTSPVPGAWPPESATERILVSLGRMEGKLDAALRRLDGHDADIDELRHAHEDQVKAHAADIAAVTRAVTDLDHDVSARITATDHTLTKMRAYLVAAWAAIGLALTLVGVIAGVVGLFR